jgi:plastocyanin
MFQKFQQLKKFTRLLPVYIIVLSIFGTLFLVRREQQIRQFASEGTPTPAENMIQNISVTPALTATVISINNSQFTPQDVTIVASTSVTWINNDTIAHTVTYVDSQNLSESFDSGSIAPGQSYAHTFTTPGKDYTYHCTIHPTMTATIHTVASVTPTAALTPTITATPSPTMTSPTPTATPTPTIPPGDTVFHLTVCPHGIGNCGDNANIASPSGGNKNPLHPARIITVNVYDVNNTLVATDHGTLVYSSSSANFQGNIDAGLLATGFYRLQVTMTQYLQRTITQIQQITKAQTNAITVTTLVTGDINNDNKLDILDYNILANCYSDLHPAKSCTAAQKLAADLNDDGAVNFIDYNLFIRELANQLGD